MILTHITNLGQSGSDMNDNEEVTPHSADLQNWHFTTRCRLVSYQGHIFFEAEDLPICRGCSWRILISAGLLLFIYIYIYEDHQISFQTFFCMGTFIDSTHMKL